MADRITLEVATPSRLVIAEQVDEVVVPGTTRRCSPRSASAS